MKENNVIQQKSFAFAVRIINLSRYLTDNGEFVISKQILRSGTSIGANIEEAIGSCSAKEFLAKFSIVYKEARETLYWLKLLQESKMLDQNQSESLVNNCEELLRIIGSIQKTMKRKLNNS
jgi:four helix bundle protein